MESGRVGANRSGALSRLGDPNSAKTRSSAPLGHALPASPSLRTAQTTPNGPSDRLWLCAGRRRVDLLKLVPSRAPAPDRDPVRVPELPVADGAAGAAP